MDKRILDYKDPWLSASTAEQCVLRAVIGTDGLSLVSTGPNGDIRYLQCSQFVHAGRINHDPVADTQALLADSAIGRYTFGDYNCSFFTPYATLAPRRLFNPSELSAYLRLLLRPETGPLDYQFEALPEFDCYLVYGVPPLLKQQVQHFFPQARMTHSAAALLSYYHKISPINDFVVFANLRFQSVQVMVFDRRNLLFYNNFAFSDTHDLLYFVLLAYDQFRLDTKLVPLTISGQIDVDADAYALLRRYIRQVRFASLPETVHLPIGIAEKHAHKLMDIFV